jgi:hypothetical protein
MEAVTVQYSLFYAGGIQERSFAAVLVLVVAWKNKENCLRGKEVLERLSLYLDIFTENGWNNNNRRLCLCLGSTI